MPQVHRVESSAVATPVNAYLIEDPDCVVVVDGTLTVSGGRALLERIDELGKPLAAVLVTHAHPDHYGGIVELGIEDEVPVVATDGVDRAIRRDDVLKEQILRPMFADEWPRQRSFPTRTVQGGDALSFGTIELVAHDLGPGESPHDSVWYLGPDRNSVFSGDQAYNGTHCYLADGHWQQWLANLEALEAGLPADATLYVGHGDPAGVQLLGEQRAYVEAFVAAVEGADWDRPEAAKQAVAAAMDAHRPSDRLRFLMELSIEPVAARLGLLPGTEG